MLASLVALWAFAAVVTVRDGVNLVWFATLEQQLAKPTEAVVAAVQVERRESVAAVTAGPGASRAALLDARAATDAAVAEMVRQQGGTLAQWSMQGATRARLDDFQRGLDTLPATRTQIDARKLDKDATATYFTGLVQRAQSVYDTFAVWDNTDVIYQTSTLLLLTQSQEMMSEEDALVAGVVGSGQFTPADRTAFTADVGVQRYLSGSIASRLTDADHTRYTSLLANPDMVALRGAEDAITAAPTGTPLAAGIADWRPTVTAAIEDVRQLVLTLADRTVTRAQGSAIWVIVRLILAAGLGLIAVIVSIRFSVRTVRSLQTQLGALRKSALDLAYVRLPRVVDRLRHGEDVDVGTAAPPLVYGTDDIGQVGEAFNVVQETAIRATVEQAELRRGVRDVFLNLARRSQAIVHRQLKLIDAMERRATTDGELAELFRIDHLATRMRRHAENLIVLSGSAPGRGWRGPVPIVDIVRGGLAEIEEYTRVTVRSVDQAALAGRAVGDVIHLLAELMENAVSFSPPDTGVHITGRRTATGYAIEIEDRGLGMTPVDLADANNRIANPPEFQLSATSRLGFYVVGRLAQRHQIRVHLRKSPYEGTTAVVLIPAELVEEFVDPRGERADGRQLQTVAATPAAAAAAGAALAAPLNPTRHFVPGDVAPAGPTVAAGEPAFTPSGLPLRARGAKPLLPRPANGHPPGGLPPRDRDAGEHPNGRDPADIRRIMAAYQDGAKRGRSQAEQALGTPDHTPDHPGGLNGSAPPIGIQIDTIGHNRRGKKGDQS